MSNSFHNNDQIHPDRLNQYTNPQRHKQQQHNLRPINKKDSYLKWGVSIIGALIALTIISSLLFGGSRSDDSTNSANTDQHTEPHIKKDSAKQGSDTPRNLGESIEVDKGLEVKVISFNLNSEFIGVKYACAYVLYENSGKKRVAFDEYSDWKAKNPSGAIMKPTSTGVDNFNNLEGGFLTPGESTTGGVCFQDAGPGTYILYFDSGQGSSMNKASWSATL